MKYTIYINQRKCIEHWLNMQQGAIIDLLWNSHLWGEWRIFDWEIYYYFSAWKMAKEYPLITSKKNTILSYLKVLLEKGLIKRQFSDNKSYYKLTAIGVEFFNGGVDKNQDGQCKEQGGVDKNQEGVLIKINGGVDKNQDNNTTNHNTTSNNTNTVLSKDNRANALEEIEKPKEIALDYLSTEQDSEYELQNATGQEIQNTNPTPPTPSPRSPRWNLLVNAIIQAITDRHGWVDGSMVQERRYAKNLASKIMKHPTWSEFRSRTDSDDEAMYQFIRTLCESATKYQTQWTTSPSWLFYNLLKIISNPPKHSVCIL